MTNRFFYLSWEMKRAKSLLFGFGCVFHRSHSVSLHLFLLKRRRNNSEMNGDRKTWCKRFSIFFFSPFFFFFLQQRREICWQFISQLREESERVVQDNANEHREITARNGSVSENSLTGGKICVLKQNIAE